MIRNIISMLALCVMFAVGITAHANQGANRAAIDTTGTTNPTDTIEKKRLVKKDRRPRRATKADTTAKAMVAQPIAPVAGATTAPKQEIGTLDAAWKPVVVDHIFGIRGGYGTGSMRREPSRDNTTLASGLLNFGISYRFDVPDQKYVGMIEFDLQFMQKGFAYALVFEGDEVYSRRYSVIEFPILWQPYFPLGKGESRFFLNLGPYVSYALGGFERTYNQKTGQTISGGEYIYDPLRDNRIEYGVIAGAGIMIGIKRFSFSFDFRYNIMMSDALKSVTKYPGNPFRSPVDHMSLNFGLQYRFIKGQAR